MDVCEAITKLGDLFRDGTRWRTGAYSDGDRMCLVGGLRNVCGHSPLVEPYYDQTYRDAKRALTMTIGREELTNWNDTHGHQEVVAMIDKTKERVC